MRGFLFGFGLLLPLLVGCSAENIVAGEEQTQAEQLSSALPAWCARVCTRLRACPQNNAACECDSDICDCLLVDDGCEQQCPASFARFTTSEACAAIGQRIKNCIDRVKCEQVGGRDPCAATAAERELCPEPSDGPPPSDEDPRTGAGPSGTSGGPSVAATPVACTESTEASRGMPPANGGGRVTCEEGRSACNDGHAYVWLCAEDSQGQRACTCLVDAQATGGFVPISSDCPSISQVNAGCAWALTP
jgi:hypothetical protein